MKQQTEQAGALQQVFFDPRLAYRFYTMCLTWFSLSLGYYGLSLNLAQMGSDVYVSSAIAALVEMPAYMLALWTVDSKFVGRRGSTVGGLVFGGSCLILSAFAVGDESEGPGLMPLVLAYAGKFAVALSFSVVYLWSMELFPTSVRSRSMGLQSLMARVGGMASSMVADLGKTSAALPVVIFGAPCLLSGLLLMGNPETRGKPLADTIDDVQEQGRGTYGRCWPRYSQLEEETGEPNSVGMQAAGPSPQVFGSTS